MTMCILEQRSYEPGEQAPQGYLAWHEWAWAQHKAGLRQTQCGCCGLWYYPQELIGTRNNTEIVCLTCEIVACNKMPNAQNAERPNANCNCSFALHNEGI